MLDENQLMPMLTVRQVSRLLHIHSNTLRRWSNQGIITPYRINVRGDRRFRLEDVDDLLSELKENGGSPKKAESISS